MGLQVGINATLSNFSPTTNISSFDSKLGYNAVAFGRLRIMSVFIQPEVGYYNNRVSLYYTNLSPSVDKTMTLGQLYTSVMIGYRMGTLRFQIGPMILQELNENISEISANNIDLKPWNNKQNRWGLQAGLGLNIAKRWQIDARFQQMLQSTSFQSTVISTTSEVLSGKMSNISVLLGYSIFKK